MNKRWVFLWQPYIIKHKLSLCKNRCECMKKTVCDFKIGQQSTKVSIRPTIRVGEPVNFMFCSLCKARSRQFYVSFFTSDPVNFTCFSGWWMMIGYKSCQRRAKNAKIFKSTDEKITRRASRSLFMISNYPIASELSSKYQF